MALRWAPPTLHSCWAPAASVSPALSLTQREPIRGSTSLPMMCPLGPFQSLLPRLYPQSLCRAGAGGVCVCVMRLGTHQVHGGGSWQHSCPLPPCMRSIQASKWHRSQQRGPHLRLDAHDIADRARHAHQGEPVGHLLLCQHKRQVSNLQHSGAGRRRSATAGSPATCYTARSWRQPSHPPNHSAQETTQLARLAGRPPAPRGAGALLTSLWSTSPADTRPTQQPQMPPLQVKGSSSPASNPASRM